MRPSRIVVVLLLLLLIAGCSPGSSPDHSDSEPAPEEIGLVEVVDQANEVNRQLEQRYADMESMIP
jgi:hypothetical protein